MGEKEAGEAGGDGGDEGDGEDEGDGGAYHLLRKNKPIGIRLE